MFFFLHFSYLILIVNVFTKSTYLINLQVLNVGTCKVKEIEGVFFGLTIIVFKDERRDYAVCGKLAFWV